MKNSKFLFIFISILIIGQTAVAQVPDIVKADKVSGTFGELVTLSGSGFSDAASDLVVHFGSSKGTIVNATEYVIEVLAPAGATYQNISVTNIRSGLTGYAENYFDLAFNGDIFEASRITESLRIKEEIELFDLCNCDFNGDGLNDVVTTNNSDDVPAASISVYQNITSATSADIKFQKINEVNLNIGKAARNLTCGDLNGDGKPELVVGKGGGNADRIYIFKNISTAASIRFEPFITVLLSENVSSSTTRRLKIHDLDNDGKPDIIMTDQGKGNVFIFGNKSTSSAINFPISARQTIQTSAGSLVGLDVADLNNDNKPEIVCNSEKSDIFTFPNQSTAGTIKFGAPVLKVITGSSLVNLKIGDLDNDGDKDIVLTNYVNNIYVLKNSGDRNNYNYGPPIYIETGRLPWGLDFGDLNGDGLPDITVSSIDAGEKLSVLLNKSTSTNISFSLKFVGNADKSFNLNVADFSGDAKPDIAYIESDNEELVFLRNMNCIVSEITPLDPPKICSNQPVILKTTPAPKVVYSWKNAISGQEVSTKFEASISQAGTYTASLKSVFDGCESTSPPLAIADGGDNLPPSVQISNPGVVCQGNSFTLSAELISGVNYVWKTPTDELLVGNQITINDAQIDDAGRYALVLESSGCRTEPNFQLVEVSTLPPMEISASEGTLFCSGTTNTLSVPLITGAQYEWKYNNVVISGATGNTYSPAKSGTYFTKVTDKNGCTANSNNLSVKEVAQPVASFADIAGSCLNEPIQFNNTSTYDATVAPVFAWDFGDDSFSTLKNPTHTYVKSGSFKVTLRVGYDNTVCSDTYEYTINVAEFLNLNIKADGQAIPNGIYDLCDGNSVELSVIAQPGQVEWSTGETTPKITVSEGGIYSVISGKNTGCSSTDEVEVNLVNNVDVEVTSGSQRIESGSSAQLGADGADFYLWAPAEYLDDATIPNPLASPPETTEYTVYGSNSFGCTDSATATVYVDAKVLIPVEAPQSFTPNGDGINDVWIIENINVYESCPIQIFNRRGIHVYDAPEYKNDWDGILNGKELPEGAYYYIMTCGGSEVHTGNVTLLR